MAEGAIGAKLHQAAISLARLAMVLINDSRLAANAREASIWSSFKEGKSSKISWCDIPDASQSKISTTAILVPVIQGLPNLISGLIEI